MYIRREDYGMYKAHFGRLDLDQKITFLDSFFPKWEERRDFLFPILAERFLENYCCERQMRKEIAEDEEVQQLLGYNKCKIGRLADYVQRTKK